LPPIQWVMVESEVGAEGVMTHLLRDFYATSGGPG
jgi:hypothetical protein